MSVKRSRLSATLAKFEGGALDPHYRAFFDCFNEQRFYEAHEVLEQLWLTQRQQPDGLFYKGLIQIAGAFVHLQKQRRQPAQALLRLAEKNLSQFPALYHELDLEAVRALIWDWLQKLDSAELLESSAQPAERPRLCLRAQIDGKK
jgi:uncharacterized protein